MESYQEAKNNLKEMLASSGDKNKGTKEEMLTVIA